MARTPYNDAETDSLFDDNDVTKKGTMDTTLRLHESTHSPEKAYRQIEYEIAKRLELRYFGRRLFKVAE